MRAAVLVVLLSIAVRAQAPAEARVEGIVLDGNDAPIPAAKVWIEHEGKRIASTQADGQGWFVLGRLPLVDLVVRATTSGRAGVAVVYPTAAGRAAFAQVATFPTRRLDVKVLDAEGRPVAEADVMATSNGPGALPWATARATTDIEGRCTLADVILGSADVLARHGETMGKVTIDVGDDLAVDVSMPVKSERRVRLRLSDASAEQIAAARVVLRCEEGDEMQMLPLPPGGVSFAPDGTATIPWLPMGLRLRVAVLSEGCCFAPLMDFVPPFQAEAKIEFRPAALPVVRAALIDEAGAPVAGVAVELQAMAQQFSPYAGVRATTADDGTFAVALPVMPEDTYLLRLAGDFMFFDSTRDACDSATVLRHTTKPADPLRVIRCDVCTGTIADARGAPAPGLRLWLVTDQVVTSSRSAHDGTFQIAVPGMLLASDIGLRLIASGAAGQARCDVKIGRDGLVRMDVRLDAAHVVTGTVVDRAGKPVGGARVRFQPMMRSGEGARTGHWTVTELDGSFRFSGHGAGTYLFGAGRDLRPVELQAGVSTLPPLVVDP